jgi:hypothetical protein
VTCRVVSNPARGFVTRDQHVADLYRPLGSPSVAAFAAIANKLPATVGFENQRAANGDWFIWLDHSTLAKLKAPRAPGESYSDVIMRAARG